MQQRFFCVPFLVLAIVAFLGVVAHAQPGSIIITAPLEGSTHTEGSNMDVHYVISGLSHQTYYVQVTHNVPFPGSCGGFTTAPLGSINGSCLGLVVPPVSQVTYTVFWDDGLDIFTGSGSVTINVGAASTATPTAAPIPSPTPIPYTSVGGWSLYE